jgi:beta-lactamase class A
MDFSKLMTVVVYVFPAVGLIHLSSCQKSVNNKPNATQEVNHTNRAGQYNVVKQPVLAPSKRLEKIVDKVVHYGRNSSLPIDSLSITLIDTKTKERAQYRGDIQQYPASIVKMFWLVVAYQKISLGKVKEVDISHDLIEMIGKSSNKAASQVIDIITNTESTQKELSKEELNLYKQKREELNTFFKNAGYSNSMDISHKTFDTEKLNGPDNQLRGDSKGDPVRNKLTTNDAARLMYEIINNQSVSPEISAKMRRMLARNIHSDFPPQPVIVSRDSNQVKGFFGQGLPGKEVENFISKTGITSQSRQEVAFIKSEDGKTQYILAVFGNNPIYYTKESIFPEISSLIYGEMKTRK